MTPLLSTNVFIYFKEYQDDEQPVTYHSERLLQTESASVIVLGGMMVDGVHTLSVEERISAAIKNTVGFGWIQSSSSCSLHHQEIVYGIAWSVTVTGMYSTYP